MSKQGQAISSLLVIAICTTMLLQPTIAQLPFPPLPPFPPFPFPPIGGGGGRFPFPLPPFPFPFPPIGGALPPFPFPFPPIGGGGGFPFPLPPLLPFPFPPIGSPSLRISSSKVEQESDSSAKCWSSIAKTEGCVQSLQWSIVGGRTSNVGPACCKAIMEITDDCMSQMFPANPSFPPLLKENCGKI